MALAIFFADCLDVIPFLKVLDMPRGARQFSDFLFSQTDLSHEAMNLKMFGKNFPDDYGRVSFPEVFSDWVTPNVLVMGFERGIELAKLVQHQVTNEETGEQEIRQSFLPEEQRKSGCSNKELANIGIKMFCKMLFEDNLIHGDLHPGNILFDDRMPGRLCILDCGLAISLSDKDKTNFKDLFYQIVHGDANYAGRMIFERSGADPSTVVDLDGYCLKIGKLIEETRSAGLRLGSTPISGVLSDLLRLSCAHHVPLEPNFVSVVVSLIVVEGVARRLDPNLNILGSMAPFLAKQQAKSFFS
jgi:aarF domain-containing kinase